MSGQTESEERAQLEVLFRAHYAALVTFVAGMLGSIDAAEDVVQDVFHAVWRRRAETPLNAIPRAYLYKAARHRALNSLRHDRVARELQPQADDALAPSAEDDMVRSDREAEVRAAIARLPDRARLMFTLNRYQGLSYAEVAQVTNVSVKTVETQIGRALRALRQSLAGLER